MGGKTPIPQKGKGCGQRKRGREHGTRRKEGQSVFEQKRSGMEQTGKEGARRAAQGRETAGEKKRSGSLERRIRGLTFRLLAVCMAGMLLVSGGAMLIMQNTSRSALQEQKSEAVKSGTALLTQEMQEQAQSYAETAGALIEEKLNGTAVLLRVIAGEVRALYENPENYGKKAVPWAKELQGTEAQLHYLLPEGAGTENEIQTEGGGVRTLGEEIGLLGNLSPLFSGAAGEEQTLLRIYFTSESGVNVGYDSDYAEKPDFFEGRETDWYRKAAAQGQTVISDTYVDSFLDCLVMTYSTPCLDSEGKLLGVLAADVGTADITQSINEMELDFKGYVMLADPAGRMIAADGLTIGNSGDFQSFLGENAETLLEEMKKNESGICGTSIGGTEKYAVYTKVEGTAWDSIIMLDRQALDETAAGGADALKALMDRAGREFAVQTAAAAVLWLAVLAGVFAGAFWGSGRVAGRISGPILELDQAVCGFGGGRMEYTARLRTGDELEELDKSFEKMARSLRTYVRDVAALTGERERLGAELDVATKIQASMLPCIFPPFPERREVDIFASMTPAREVGGDFYDFFLVGENRLCLVIADVSGKGVPAALFMVIAKTLIKDNLLLGKRPAEVFSRVNSQLCENNEAGMFVTCFLGVLELDSGIFTYVSAGHNPPLLMKRGGQRIWLDAPSGFVLAAADGMEYREGTAFMEPGDLFFGYTDGVTEAMDPAGDLYTERRLFDVLERACGEHYSARDTVLAVLESVRTFAGAREQADDITVLALYRNDESGGDEKRTLTVEASETRLDEIRRFIEEGLEKAGASSSASRELQTAAEEIFVNIAAYAYTEGGTVRLTLETDGDCALLYFADSGVPYDPLAQEAPKLGAPAEERPVGGLGIFMAKNLTDRMEYRRENGENLLLLRKRLR